VDKDQQPVDFYKWLSGKFGDLSNKLTFLTYADYVFNNSLFLDDTKWTALMNKLDTALIHKDPAFMVCNTFVGNYNAKCSKFQTEFLSKNAFLGKTYLRGILEMNKGKKMYPDANFTMRVSFGNVKSYEPRDAVKYSHICTLKGVLEKYKPNDYEFDLPAKLLELAKNKDFGQYADPVAKDIVVGYITTNDITGGNSGSPVLNAKGELIGLCFDGNYEALSHKIAFDKNLNRTICVDVRYILWIVEKLGGANNIIEELDLKKN
jgi:hypothetical protein